MLLLSVPTNRLVVPALPVSFYSMEEKPRLRCLFSLCQKASTGTFCAVPVGSRGRLVLLPYPVAEALLSTSRRHRRGLRGQRLLPLRNRVGNARAGGDDGGRGRVALDEAREAGSATQVAVVGGERGAEEDATRLVPAGLLDSEL